jgi:hypothetical protein
MSRNTVGNVAGSSQLITSPFQSILSSQNSGVMSTEAREAMEHMDRILQGSESFERFTVESKAKY